MQFHATSLSGAFVVDVQELTDERGSFARTWSAEEFRAKGLPPEVVQSSVSRNHRRGTVRGMHLQLPPSREAKFVRCTRGVVFDVIIDLRPDSPTYLRHFGVELSAVACNALFVPALCAHGFQTLEDHSEVSYQMTDVYTPDLAYGLRWNDPAFGIEWPLRRDLTILPRDNEYADFDEQAFRLRLSGVRP